MGPPVTGPGARRSRGAVTGAFAAAGGGVGADGAVSGADVDHRVGAGAGDRGLGRDGGAAGGGPQRGARSGPAAVRVDGDEGACGGARIQHPVGEGR